MPLYRTLLVLFGALITMTIPSLVVPTLMSGAHVKITDECFSFVLAGFVLAPISLFFLWNPTKLGIFISLSAFVLTFAGQFLNPLLHSVLQRTNAAINLAFVHLLMLALACIFYLRYAKKT